MKRIWFALGCCAFLAAMAAAPASAQDASKPQAAARPLDRFELLANLGYGNATTDFTDVKLNPYGALFGVDAGYTWRFGLRLGLHVDYGLGRSESQRYDRALLRDISFTSEGQSASSSLSLGYDMWLYFLILRYSLDLGISWMRWDFGDLPYASLGGYASLRDTVVGFHLAPRLALLWPIGRVECGLGMRYLVQVADEIPSGLVGELLLGVAL
jgi:hypothetical protein